MTSFLENLLATATSQPGDMSSHALLQLAMLLEKSSRPSDEEGFYESILPPEALALELNEQEQTEILREIAKQQQPPDVAASFLWAVGKSSPNVGLPVLLGFVKDHSEILRDSNVGYQAVIALDNFLGDPQSGGLDEPATRVLQAFLEEASASSDERLAAHSSRLLKRLKPKKSRKTS